MTQKIVAVFGAYGHTGRFVVAELLARGFDPLLIGRDEARLREFADLRYRVAAADGALDLAGAHAVVNAAGPFAATAAPVIEAALRAKIPYVDVAAEIEANTDTFTHFSEPARAADVAVVPAMAFFGGLGDLLVTAAMRDWQTADEAHVAYGLSSWHPTAGTLASGAVSRDRRAGRRVRYTGGRLDYYTPDGDLPAVDWDFPAPLGRRTVLGDFTMADVVTIPSHLAIPEVRTYMTTTAATDLATPGTPAPDPSVPSGQTFTVDVLIRSGRQQRRASATGHDIYAISAPLAVEAVTRLLDGRTHTTGVASAGTIFDAPDFLRALSPYLSVRITPC
ncbi:saccharopine dehydrogenase NADP-binding domain-containing protein [Actinoplanes utahensis]|uniref:Saccharopine dehydrogenase n=1 Tax=Actinoplanes utahensis TaxID=1869 RepID=A0A0A6UV22_ACTUT|nr:saccharopine dehydrogenase NADP-binding domain-containing protein [Actinoplanes utahensis]KHD79321.1 saccharopine dehydrogenase [Actinoplanes utahensis]GIF30292.1 saccharopine dehydrogenase [Actinoplanes utahensis]